MKIINTLSATLILCTIVLAKEAGTTRGIINLENTAKPEGAVELVGEKGYDLVPDGVGDMKWSFEDGVLTASPLWDSLLTKDAYQDFQMHVEFNVNNNEKADNLEANGNSGVYIQERYELQIHNPVKFRNVWIRPLELD